MARKMTSYLFYGLRINSEISLDPLQPVKNNLDSDVIISKGVVQRPEDGQERTMYKPATVLNERIFYWKVTGIASYLLTGKDDLIIDKEKGVHWQDVRAFLFDTVLSVVLIKHEKFVFHASAVAYKGGAYLFCCPPGSGKSTIAAMLLKKRMRFIEDDRCLLHWDEKKKAFMIQNYVPIASLWPNIRVLDQIKNVRKLSPVRKAIRKHYYDVSQLVSKRPVEVKKLILMNMNNGEDRIEKTDLKGISNINVVRTYSHLDHMINALGKGKEHFRVIADISKYIPAVKIERSQLTPIPQFVSYIQDEIAS